MTMTSDGKEVSKEVYDKTSEIIRESNITSEHVEEVVNLLNKYKSLLWITSAIISTNYKEELKRYQELEQEICLKTFKKSPEAINVYDHLHVLDEFINRNEKKFNKENIKYNLSEILKDITKNKTLCMNNTNGLTM